MKPANLMVLSQGFESVPEELLPSFEAQLCEREEPLTTVKSHEAESVVRLVRSLRAHGATRPLYFEGFVFSFRIPQISSEFDLLKITDRVVVNVELKSESVGSHRITEQLERNRHYLAPLGRTVYTFTFVSDTGRLYERGEDGPVRQVSVERLVGLLGSAGVAYDGVVEDLFKVSNYLVSPLNDTDKFLNGHYFLTNHQMQIRSAFLKACDSGNQAPCFMVYGSAGTGKSLLLYDIARALDMPWHPCVIHCGVLSEGHEALNAGQETFHVISARHLERANLETYGAILVDEAQRLWPSQLRRVAGAAAAAGIPLYLSLDRRQVLSRREDAYDAEQVVRASLPQVSVWELSRKIRTNRELEAFIRALFELRGGERYARTNHVKVAAAHDAAGARELVDAFRDEGYQFISFAASSSEVPAPRELDIAGCPNPNTVIGQEFDKVVMAIGPQFTLERDHMGRLLLYQGLTRARSEIALVVFGNDEMLQKLLGML